MAFSFSGILENGGIFPAKTDCARDIGISLLTTSVFPVLYSAAGTGDL